MKKLETLTFKKFCMTIGNLPSSYVESLSYYECLMWLCNYLQTEVIPTVNNNSEAVEELQGLFIELKSYVDNYFDNLDVQEEINNKLDKMVEEGTLQEIIADYLNSKAVFGYDTVSDMKAATNLIDGSYAKTLGYHSINDGGGSYYKIRNIINTDVIDDTTIIPLNDENLVAEIVIHNNTLNLENFGSYGDGTHDDSEAIQEAITYCSSNNIKLVGNKNYLINNSLTISSKIKLDINNIVNNGDDEALIITSNDNEIKINQITNNSNKAAIYLEASNNILNVYKIVSDGSGILLKPTATKLNHNNNINIGFIESDLNGIELIANSWGILDNIIKFNYIAAGNDYYGIYCYAEHDGESEHVAYIGEVSFYGGRVDNGTYGIYCKSIGENPTQLCEITGLKFYNISVEGTTNGFYFYNAQYSVIDNPRYSELNVEDGLILKLSHNCRNCTFNGSDTITLNKIDVTELTNIYQSANMINTKIRMEAGGYIGGKNAIAYSNGIFFENNEKYLQTTKATTSIDLRSETVLPQVFRLTNTGNISLILNKNYDVGGIDEIYIIKPESTSVITIYDQDGTTTLYTIPAGTGFTHLVFNQDHYLIKIG